MSRHSTVRAAIRRVVTVWADLDHASRRLVEIQAGIERNNPRGRRAL